MKTMNLIERQQAAIDEILTLGENGRRAMEFGLSFMNKKGRGLKRIRKAYWLSAEKMGYTAKQIECQWQDIKDMALLAKENRHLDRLKRRLLDPLGKCTSQSDLGDNAAPCPECSATGQHYAICSQHE